MPESAFPPGLQRDVLTLHLAVAVLRVRERAALVALLPDLADWLAGDVPRAGQGHGLQVLVADAAGAADRGVSLTAVAADGGTAVVGHVLGPLDALEALSPQRVVAAGELLGAALERLSGGHDTAEQTSATHAEAERLKLDVVALLSHEMRTPLASIKGYATALLLEDVAWSESDRTSFLQAIDDEADHLTRLVSDVLEAANLEAGGIRIVREPVLLPRLVRRVLDAMRVTTDRHRFLLSMPERLPVVETDPQRVEQVLKNLLDNAVKYAPHGGLVIVRGEVADGNSEVVLSVVDEGMGIAPEHLNRLFERFFRARGTDAGGVAGAGLGLPISQSIVHALGGRIWAESTLGSGTTLSFTLPLGSGSDDADDAAAHA